MRHRLDYARPLDDARPVAYARPPARGRLRELLSWFAAGAAGAVGGVLLVALLASVTVKFDNGHGDARLTFTKSAIASYSTALDAFGSDVGRHPTDAEGLAALASRPDGLPGWKGPYQRQIICDPWGRPYVYHLGGPAGGAGYRVVSVGADGREGTDDDVAGGSDEAPVRIARPATQPQATEPCGIEGSGATVRNCPGSPRR